MPRRRDISAESKVSGGGHVGLYSRQVSYREYAITLLGSLETPRRRRPKRSPDRRAVRPACWQWTAHSVARWTLANPHQRKRSRLHPGGPSRVVQAMYIVIRRTGLMGS